MFCILKVEMLTSACCTELKVRLEVRAHKRIDLFFILLLERIDSLVRNGKTRTWRSSHKVDLFFIFFVQCFLSWALCHDLLEREGEFAWTRTRCFHSLYSFRTYKINLVQVYPLIYSMWSELFKKICTSIKKKKTFIY